MDEYYDPEKEYIKRILEQHWRNLMKFEWIDYTYIYLTDF